MADDLDDLIFPGKVKTIAIDKVLHNCVVSSAKPGFCLYWKRSIMENGPAHCNALFAHSR